MKMLRKLTAAWFRAVTRFLRLSSYFYGGRYKEQEANGTGDFVFVPSFDHAYKPEERKEMTSKPVRERDLERYGLLDRGYFLGLGQDAPIRVNRYADTPDIPPKQQSNFHQLDQRYTIVYRPDNFRLRIFSLLILLWFSICSFCLHITLVPVLLGRAIASNLMVRDLHDLYTFQLGFHSIWISYFVTRALSKKIKEAKLRSVDQFLMSTLSFVWKSCKLVYMVSVMFGFLPLMFGFFLDLLTWVFRSNEASVIFFPINEWLFGLGVGKVVLQTAFILLAPTSSIRNAIERMRIDSLWNLDFVSAHRNIIIPIFSCLTGLIAGPWAIVKFISFILRKSGKRAILTTLY